MDTWYIAIGGQQQGPFNQDRIQQGLTTGIYTRDTLVWRQGFANWLTIAQVPELQQPSFTPPPKGSGTMQAHEIDYQIHGNEMQFVEIELDPQESAIAEAGAMMYMSDGIQMATIFGDGSHSSESGGFMDKMLGAGTRLITGESLFTTVFTFVSQGKVKWPLPPLIPGRSSLWI